jgi:TetR/AcrR family transcriptional regulator, transcriptional repressor for nem operon
MPGQTVTKESTKVLLLERGTEIMLEKGYNNTGIMEVLQATGVPKGSFYHYFESKEDFGLQIINHFEQLHREKLDLTIGNKALKPLERVRAFCDRGIESFLTQKCRKGCLIGNLSQEMADQSEVFRKRLLEIQTESTRRFVDCFAEAQKSGVLRADYNCHDLAETFHAGWAGATVRAKTCKTVEPMQSFTKFMFTSVLKP